MSKIRADFVRSLSTPYFKNFSEAYKKYNKDYENFDKETNRETYFSAGEIYYMVDKYNNNVPAEKLYNEIETALDSNDFFSAMVITMVSRNNLTNNGKLNEDMFDNLKIEDNVGAGEYIKLYNLIIDSFVNGALDGVYINKYGQILDELKTAGKIDEKNYNKCRYLIDNYSDFQDLINKSVDLNNKLANQVESIHYFDDNGNIFTWEKGLNHKFYENNMKLSNSLENLYMSADNFPDGFFKYINVWVDKEVEWFKDHYEEINHYSRIKNNLNQCNSKVITARNARYDPLILDLDGDGFNIETKENGTNFDLDKNGLAEKINWTRKDGILCLDLNGNGKVDNGGEVFGDWTILPDGARAKNGFEALAQYDSNGDGIIDADDEIFSQLRVWVDADGDGISGDGELKTLSELGIVSINLGYENVNAETGTEALIGNTATFTRADGTTGKAGELWVSADLFDTEDRLDVEVSDEIAALPNIKSIGNVYSLHSAIALDETGELKALVDSFISEEDADKRIAITEQILFFISGAKNIDANSRGAYIDARQLAVIEAMLGEKYEGTTGSNSHSDAAPMLKSAYQAIMPLHFLQAHFQYLVQAYRL